MDLNYWIDYLFNLNSSVVMCATSELKRTYKLMLKFKENEFVRT